MKIFVSVSTVLLGCNTITNRIDNIALECGTDFPGGPYFVVHSPDGKRLSGDEFEILPLSEKSQTTQRISTKGCISKPNSGEYLVRSLKYDWVDTVNSEKLKLSEIITLQDTLGENVRANCDEEKSLSVGQDFMIKDFLSSSLPTNLKNAFRVKYEISKVNGPASKPTTVSFNELETTSRPFSMMSEEGDYLLKLTVLNLVKNRESSPRNCKLRFDRSPPHAEFSVNQSTAFETTQVHETSSIALVNLTDSVGFVSKDLDVKEIEYCLEKIDDEFSDADTNKISAWKEVIYQSDCDYQQTSKVSPNRSIATESRSGFYLIRYRAVDNLGNTSISKSQIFLFIHRDSIDLTKSLLIAKVNSALLESKNLDAAKAVLDSSDFRRSLPTQYEKNLLKNEVLSGLLRVMNSKGVDVKLKGHLTSPRKVLFSTDGQLLISASEDKTVKIWDSNTAILRKSIAIDRGYPTSLAVDSQSKTLYVGGQDGSIRTWDLNTFEELESKFLHAGSVRAIAVGHGTMASIAEPGEINVWNTSDQKLIHRISVIGTVLNSYESYSIDLSPDGNLIVTSDSDRNISIWDTKTGGLLKKLEGFDKTGTSPVRFNKDGSRILYLSNSDLLIWDLQDESRNRKMGIPVSSSTAFDLSGDGIKAVIGTEFGIFFEPIDLQPERERNLWPLTPSLRRPVALSLSPNGKQLATAVEGLPSESLTIWTSLEDLNDLSLKGISDYNSNAKFDALGERLIIENPNQSRQVWDIATRTLIETRDGSNQSFNFVDHSSDGKFASYASYDGKIAIFDNVKREILHQMDTGLDLGKIIISSDNRLLVVGAENRIIFWDLKSGEKKFTLEGKFLRPQGFAMTSDSALLFVAEVKGNIAVWSMDKREKLFDLAGHKDTVQSMNLSRDNRTLYSSGRDNTIRIWDIPSRKVTRTIEGHKEWVQSVALSPDERLLASGSKDSHVMLWDLENGNLLADMSRGRSAVQKVLFSPDGKKLVAEDEGGQLNIYDVDLDTLANRLCKLLKGFISPKTCKDTSIPNSTIR